MNDFIVKHFSIVEKWKIN